MCYNVNFFGKLFGRKKVHAYICSTKRNKTKLREFFYQEFVN